ncbi:MAG: hypothetical protein WKF74_13115 [Pyrinomonadaceae bacterium]
MRKLTEEIALARLQRHKAEYQTHIKLNYEHRAEDCRTCPVAGSCCTDAHFVNVHITRLEAVAMRETLQCTPRLDETARRRVYQRAREAVAKYHLRPAKDSYAQTYACPLFEPGTGCLVHRRAKPAPCIQHGCYEKWEDVPPAAIQWRAEHRVEEWNNQVYGAAWAWLPTPLWLTLVDPEADAREFARLVREWSARKSPTNTNPLRRAQGRSRNLPVVR